MFYCFEEHGIVRRWGVMLLDDRSKAMHVVCIKYTTGLGRLMAYVFAQKNIRIAQNLNNEFN